jgi:hypothetical protein
MEQEAMIVDDTTLNSVNHDHEAVNCLLESVQRSSVFNQNIRWWKRLSGYLQEYIVEIASPA